MASELGVQTIQHTNGTDAITIDSSGSVDLPNTHVISRFHLDTNYDLTTTTTALTNFTDSHGSRSFVRLGSAVTESSGVFTLPKNGYYRVSFQTNIANSTADNRFVETDLQFSTDSGSTYDNHQTYLAGLYSYGFTYEMATATRYVNVTDATNSRFRVRVRGQNANGRLDSGFERTHILFERLADNP